MLNFRSAADACDPPSHSNAVASAGTIHHLSLQQIKRAIRDLYNKDIDEILVAGDDAYREAKDFMRMLMPSHAKLVQPYREPAQLFAKHGIEAQLDSMFSNQVKKQNMSTVFLEYAWDMAWCDPCAADPLSNDQLRKLTGLGRRLQWGFIPAEALQTSVDQGFDFVTSVTLTAAGK